LVLTVVFPVPAASILRECEGPEELVKKIVAEEHRHFGILHREPEKLHMQAS
jgi:hypothetical protein